MRPFTHHTECKTELTGACHGEGAGTSSQCRHKVSTWECMPPYILHPGCLTCFTLVLAPLGTSKALCGYKSPPAYKDFSKDRSRIVKKLWKGRTKLEDSHYLIWTLNIGYSNYDSAVLAYRPMHMQSTVFNKGAKVNQQRKDSLFKNAAGTIEYAYVKKKDTDLYFTPGKNTYLIMGHRSKCKS